jgi:RES domain-containing protein
MPRSRLGLRLLEQALADIRLDPRELAGFWRVGFPDRDLLDPTRSREHFGRWHNPASTGALYFAAELSTALRELHAHLDPPFPEVVQAVEATVRLHRLLDLVARPSNTPIARHRDRALADTPRAFFRGALLGEAGFRKGADGILVQCLRGPGACLCVFTDATPPPSIDVTVRRLKPAPWDKDGNFA